MFSYIDSKGQVTEGIFTTHVNGQAYRALREKLNSREHVDWTSESPCVVATVLKVRNSLVSSGYSFEIIMLCLLPCDG